MRIRCFYGLLFALPLVAGMTRATERPANSQQAPAAQDEKALVVVDKTMHNFGEIVESEGVKTARFVVTNRTDAPILIVNARTSCGCTTANWTKTPIEPGKTGVVTVQYDPAARPGPFDKTVTIYTNSTPSRMVVRVTGTVQ
jgi:hypothetical protein